MEHLLILVLLFCALVVGVQAFKDPSQVADYLLEEDEGTTPLNMEENEVLMETEDKPKRPLYQGKRQRLRQERRLERQERREERRKNRHRQSESKNNDKFGAIQFGSDPNSDLPNNLGDVLFPNVGLDPNHNGVDQDRRNKIEYVTDFRWLGSNLSAIWEILYQMQNEMKQMRRLYRLIHDNKKNGRRDQSSHEATFAQATDEECDPQFDVNPDDCIAKTGSICGGNGRCICGQCTCNAPYYGIHCQCNDNNCQQTGGLMCGGPDKGQCRCGSCVCRPGYTGRDCGCQSGTSECETSVTGTICSGKGECVCNRCQCQDGQNGKYCEDSIYSAIKCESLKLCVLCQAFGKKYPQCADCNVEVFMVEELESSRATCIMIHLDCILKYAYVLPNSKEEKTMVLVQGTQNSC